MRIAFPCRDVILSYINRTCISFGVYYLSLIHRTVNQSYHFKSAPQIIDQPRSWLTRLLKSVIKHPSWNVTELFFLQEKPDIQEKTCMAASDENFVKMVTFSFDWLRSTIFLNACITVSPHAPSFARHTHTMQTLFWSSWPTTVVTRRDIHIPFCANTSPWWMHWCCSCIYSHNRLCKLLCMRDVDTHTPFWLNAIAGWAWHEIRYLTCNVTKPFIKQNIFMVWNTDTLWRLCVGTRGLFQYKDAISPG